VADILSRRADHYPLNGEESEHMNPFPEGKILPLEELESATMDAETAWEHGLLCLIDSDAKFLEEIESLVTEMDPKGEDGRIWVPPLNDLRRRIVELYHDTPLMGHLGITGTYKLVTRGYTWEGIHDYVTKYVTFCSTCIRAKKWNYKLHGTLKPLLIPEGPWQWTESNHIVKLPKSRGYDSIYVVVNRFTKMAHFIPTTEKASEDDLIDLHMRNVWKLHGMPLIHSTDRHGNFTSKYIRKMFKALGIEQRFSTAYHPQTQGQVENLNGWLETYLRMFCDHQKRNWASLLHTAEFAWNNHYHSSLGMMPFYANSGMHPTTTDVPSIGQTDTVGRITRIHESRELARALLARAQEEQRVTYD
jgi:transposase InsO family protein